jgi:serine phosphatase RsbU (regulator of sigma subunit)
VRWTVIALLVGVVFILRLFDVAAAGTIFILPTLLAAFWLGRPGGLATAVASAAAYALARAIEPGGESLSVAETGFLRLGIFGVSGYLVGWLSEQRAKLTTTVSEQQAELVELRGIQRALAPRESPRRPSLELASCYVPAEEGAAGDFYLVTAAPHDATVVVVGDVAGKGIEAARRAAFVRTALATSAPYTDDPCRLLELANAALLELGPRPDDMLVTCAVLAFAPGTHTLTYALAGHPAPMWLDNGKPLNHIRPAYPLGIEPKLDCESSSTTFAPGSGVIAFTDGLTEARRRGRGELFGVDRIERTLEKMRGEPPARVVRELRNEAERFAGGALPDDLCIVALRAS